MMESTTQSLRRLEELIAKSDVVFFLLDSREARWLPTVLCAAMNKIAINAALGFDSFTVQRHGTRNSSSPSSPDFDAKDLTGSDLGCYFCNDVTQPGNVRKDDHTRIPVRVLIIVLLRSRKPIERWTNSALLVDRGCRRSLRDWRWNCW